MGASRKLTFTDTMDWNDNCNSRVTLLDQGFELMNDVSVLNYVLAHFMPIFRCLAQIVDDIILI